MDDFRAHEGWCPNGAGPDGSRRLDMFPEWGDAFPVWDAGNGCSDEPLSADLTAALHAWNREWEATAGDASSPVADHAAWLTRGEGLAQRVEEETGAVVIVLGPERRGPAFGCPHCGPDAIVVDDVADRIRMSFFQVKAFMQRAETSWQSGDLGSARDDIDAARGHMQALSEAVRRSDRGSA